MPDIPTTLNAQLFTPKQAATSLAISPRKLWSLTAEGTLPVVRIGRAVRYDRADLEAFIDAKKQARG